MSHSRFREGIPSNAFTTERVNHPAIENNQMNAESERLPLRTKVAWGVGGIADNLIFNTITLLLFPIYNIGLGLDAFWVGVAAGIPRIIDAFTDPIVGNISDNYRSRWGRRKPFMLVGVIVCALILPLMWLPPIRSQMGLFAYLTSMQIVYFGFGYTCFVIPYTAIGFEQTSNYNEKTRLMAWRMYLGLIAGFSLPWIYKLSVSDIFANEVIGARFVCIGISAIILITGLLPVFLCRERMNASNLEKIPFRRTIVRGLHNRRLATLLLTYVILLSGIFTGFGLLIYVNIFYLCGGNKAQGASLVAASGTIMAIGNVLSLPMTTWISAKIGKKKALMICMSFTSISASSYMFTLNPSFPELQFISSALIGLSLQGCWLMINSLIADISDLDRAQHDISSEGFYASTLNFFKKLTLGWVQLFLGILLWLFNFHNEPEPAANSRILHGFIGFQTFVPILAILVFCRFQETNVSDHLSTSSGT